MCICQNMVRTLEALDDVSVQVATDGLNLTLVFAYLSFHEQHESHDVVVTEVFRAGLPPKQPRQLSRGSSPGGGPRRGEQKKQMYSFTKSPEAKLCKKLQYHPYSSSRKLHPNHSVSTQPHTKTRLHTISKNISISPRKMMEIMPDKNNLDFFFHKIFQTFFGGGAGGGPSALRGASAPRKDKIFLS